MYRFICMNSLKSIKILNWLIIATTSPRVFPKHYDAYIYAYNQQPNLKANSIQWKSSSTKLTFPLRCIATLLHQNTNRTKYKIQKYLIYVAITCLWFCLLRFFLSSILTFYFDLCEDLFLLQSF